MDIFIAYPVLAAVVALVLGLLAGKQSSKPLALAAALWLQAGKKPGAAKLGVQAGRKPAGFHWCLGCAFRAG